METARILKDIGVDATVYYVAFSAEEQGYFGSKKFVSSLDKSQFSNLGPKSGQGLERAAHNTPKSTWEGAIIMDMATGFKGGLSCACAVGVTGGGGGRRGVRWKAAPLHPRWCR